MIRWTISKDFDDGKPSYRGGTAWFCNVRTQTINKPRHELEQPDEDEAFLFCEEDLVSLIDRRLKDVS